jgi:hypothetical protein
VNQKIGKFGLSQDFLNILTLIFLIFPPLTIIGFVFMWFLSTWSKPIKIIITIILLIIVLFIAGTVVVLQGWRAG